ncbi:MAG: hypothetical protein WBW69_00210 [Candidatus Korobacteraceae bacterium]
MMRANVFIAAIGRRYETTPAGKNAFAFAIVIFFARAFTAAKPLSAQSFQVLYASAGHNSSAQTGRVSPF